MHLIPKDKKKKTALYLRVISKIKVLIPILIFNHGEEESWSSSVSSAHTT